MWNIMKENDGWYLSLTCWTPLDATFSVCLADFFNLLGTASSSSVETTSKYNASAINNIQTYMYSRQSGLMLSVLNPGWSGWLCFLQQVNTSARLKVRWCKKTDLILPQAHLTQSIFPIQSSHFINKESPPNPFVELSCIKI